VEVLRHVAAGATNAADRRSYARDQRATVDRHVSNIFTKLRR
jgi:hypothetical protein